MPRRKRHSRMPEPTTVEIESMSHEGRGIAHIDGKTVFVFGALVGEVVRIQIKKISRKYDEAITLEVIKASDSRINPKCAAFEVCGGCSLQHLNSDDQVEFKQQSVIDTLTHAGIKIGEIMPALRSNPWGYRRKARLGVKYVQKKGRLLVGFRERGSAFLADIQQCEVLVPQVGQYLQDLCRLIDGLDAKQSIPQIELAADDEHTVLVFRHLQDLSERDRAALIEFAKTSGFWLQLQSAGPDSIVNLWPQQQVLSFSPLIDSDIRVEFNAADFIQVNTDINQQMVAQAIDLLDLQPTDRVLDLFCGLGNFTLPIARQCAQVTGVEGDAAMVARAKQNALGNQIQNTEYYAVDLTKPDLNTTWMRQKYDKILIDPPRSGALEIAEIINQFKAERIVYVSCQPSSLVRDSKIITDQGYKLSHLGVIDMFPQTAHVESMAVFTN